VLGSHAVLPVCICEQSRTNALGRNSWLDHLVFPTIGTRLKAWYNRTGPLTVPGLVARPFSSEAVPGPATSLLLQIGPFNTDEILYRFTWLPLPARVLTWGSRATPP